LPLERALTDFGTDVPFGKVVEKMKEHYGIEVPSSTIRLITEKHAFKVASLKKTEASYEQVLVSETVEAPLSISEEREKKQMRCGFIQYFLTFNRLFKIYDRIILVSL
jgi:hypothetical protein